MEIISPELPRSIGSGALAGLLPRGLSRAGTAGTATRRRHRAGAAPGAVTGRTRSSVTLGPAASAALPAGAPRGRAVPAGSIPPCPAARGGRTRPGTHLFAAVLALHLRCCRRGCGTGESGAGGETRTSSASPAPDASRPSPPPFVTAPAPPGGPGAAPPRSRVPRFPGPELPRERCGRHRAASEGTRGGRRWPSPAGKVPPQPRTESGAPAAVPPALQSPPRRGNGRTGGHGPQLISSSGIKTPTTAIPRKPSAARPGAAPVPYLPPGLRLWPQSGRGGAASSAASPGRARRAHCGPAPPHVRGGTAPARSPSPSRPHPCPHLHPGPHIGPLSRPGPSGRTDPPRLPSAPGSAAELCPRLRCSSVISYEGFLPLDFCFFLVALK